MRRDGPADAMPVVVARSCFLLVSGERHPWAGVALNEGESAGMDGPATGHQGLDWLNSSRMAQRPPWQAPISREMGLVYCRSTE
ncbi:hypothetical protein ACAN107058_01200 [Paracidovorax anthurii]|uniref:Uncharacterized protein n=1 Tax=Paracidovorax anthurii TaxID=78229 RepID=A0A328ZF68_9BURK|nr:hypothetical protein AX018_101043 [Paracidovorax anthurii]